MNPRDIAHWRLASQRIGRAAFETPAEVVHWLGAVQAQDYALAKWALGVRMARATDAGIEQAFNAGEILRTHVLRPTWHFVTPADIRWLLALTAPRVNAATTGRHRSLGLDQQVFKRSRTVLERALRDGKHLTRDELRPLFQRAGIATDFESRMSHILGRAELDGLICSGPRKGKQFTFALLDERVPPAPVLPREEALARLAERFFTSRGPATAHDFAGWASLTVSDARRAIAANGARLRHEAVDGRSYWLVASTTPRRRGPPAHLLSIFDEFMSGYKDRSALIAPEHIGKFRDFGNARLFAIIVVNAQIVGTWRRTLGRGEVAIALDLFTALTRAQERAIARAADRYGEFLGLRATISARP